MLHGIIQGALGRKVLGDGRGFSDAKITTLVAGDEFFPADIEALGYVTVADQFRVLKKRNLPAH